MSELRRPTLTTYEYDMPNGTRWKITQRVDQLTFDLSWRASQVHVWTMYASFEALESAQLYIQNYPAPCAER